MKTILAFTILLAACALARPAGGQIQRLVFIGVNVVPMDRERVLTRQTVIVSEGKIAAIGPASRVKAPFGAKIIDGKGRYLIPGLADMHFHLRRPEAFRIWSLLLVANGDTTVRNMWGTAGPLNEGPGGIPGASRYVETVAEAEAAVAQDQAAGYDAIKVYNMLSRPCMMHL